MRVLFLVNIPSPYRVNFFNELGKLCNLTVLYERRQASDRDAKWQSNKSKNYQEIFLKGIAIGNDSGVCPSIIKYLKDKQYDIIVIGGYSTPTGMLAIEYLSLNKIPFFLNFDGGIIKKDNGLKYKIKEHFISTASAYLSTGENTNKYLLHYGAKAQKIYIYPFTSIYKSEILKSQVPEEEKISIKNKLNIKQSKIVLAVGRFIPLKYYDRLIRAWKNFDTDFALYIIGGGEEKSVYEDLIEKLQINNIILLDHKTKEQLEEYYRVADLFVHPTSSDVWGLVINEAMAFGLPIITTDNCIAGLELIENNKNGFIVPVGDEEQLAEKISFILNNNEIRARMKKENLQKISNYTIENMAQRHYEIFRKMYGEKI